MRADLQTLERIEAYLNGFMTSPEKEQFETELNNSNDLQTILDHQQLIQQAVARKAIMAQIKQFAPATVSSISFWTKFKWPIILSSIVLMALVGFSFVDNSEVIKENKSEVEKKVISEKKFEIKEAENTESKDDLPQDSPCKSTIEESTNNLKTSKSNDLDGLNTWITPDKQIFDLNPQNSHTLECKNGTLIIVPKNAFKDKSGNTITENVQLEIVEALNMADMLAYNLTTVNNDKALQSGGMLYVQPFVHGEKVEIHSDKPLHIEVPTQKIVPGMMAWKGIVDEKGNINWEEPKEIKRFLVPVNFNTLDFLPEGLANTVDAGLPFKKYKKSSHELVDSLYYSLSVNDTKGETSLFETVAIPYNSSPKILKTGDGKRRNDSAIEEASKPDTVTTFFSPKLQPLTIITDGTNNQIISGAPQQSKIADLQLKIKGISPEDLKNTVIIFDPSGSNNLPKFNLDGTIYIRSNLVTDRKNNYILRVKTACNEPIDTEITLEQLLGKTTIDYKGKSCTPKLTSCYINPLSIKSIKTVPFENTFIATKEFEARLHELHKIPNAQEFLDLYINNLTKNLSDVDQLIANKLKGKHKTIFQAFANEKLTNVDNDEINQEDLKAYYNSSRKKFQKEVEEVRKQCRSLTEKELASVQNQLNKLNHDYYSSSVITNTRGLSFPRINIGNQKSLSVPQMTVATTPSYKLSWNSGGWVNIDAYYHILSNGEQIVSIDTQRSLQNIRIYQCINFVKTIIPLNNMDGMYEAHFPKEGKEGSESMKDTYCVGIQKDSDQLYFSEKRYNPYIDKTIYLDWVTITEVDLYSRLKQMSPMNDVLIKALDNEKENIAKEIERRKEKERIDSINKIKEAEFLKEQARLDVIIQAKQLEIAKENAFIQSLIDKINPCDPNFGESVSCPVVEQNAEDFGI